MHKNYFIFVGRYGFVLMKRATKSSMTNLSDKLELAYLLYFSTITPITMEMM